MKAKANPTREKLLAMTTTALRASSVVSLPFNSWWPSTPPEYIAPPSLSRSGSN